jgi:diaminopimelate decarboxylase
MKQVDARIGEPTAGEFRPGPDESAELVARFGSPLYVYDLAAVEHAYRRFVSAFGYEAVHCYYAIVCNKNPYIVRRLHDLGAGVHANTPGDAYAAIAAGVSSSRIVYSGTNLNDSDLEYLLGHGIHLNLDSLDQLRLLATRRTDQAFGLRLLVDDPEGRNRIGVTVDQIPEALKIAHTSGLRLTGLHMYSGTNTMRLDRFLECLARMATASERLPDLEYLDVGGGFGIPYADGQPQFDLSGLGRSLGNVMQGLSSRRRRTIRLLLEPGRILVGAAGSLLVTVVSVKERGGRRFIGVDSTVGNIVVASVYHAHHRLEPVRPRGAALPGAADVCGNTTHSRDFLGRNLRLPEVRPGDLMVLRDVGAYGYAMSSHFLNRPRPAEVVLDGDDVVLTTRRETLQDLLAATEST